MSLIRFQTAECRGHVEPVGCTCVLCADVRRMKEIHAHKADCVQVEWSPAGDRVASCSLDSSIAIWDAVTGEMVSTLCRSEVGSDWRRLHGWRVTRCDVLVSAGNRSQGHVKGIAWDPIGSFIASQVRRLCLLV